MSVVLWLGATEVLSLEMTIGQLIAFNMMTNHIAQPLSRMVELWGQFIQTRVALEKLGDMLNLPVEQHTGNDMIDNARGYFFQKRSVSLPT